MIARSFVDTNVFVYADDPRDPFKQARAMELVTAGLRTRLGVVSTQVLQEYFSTAIRKLRLDAGLARTKVELMASMSVVPVDPALILSAIDLHRLHQLSLWDALILQAAAAAGCRELLSEDMQTGFRHGGVVIVNPFE
jgi:predicted nucleic acid-binding protein